LTKGRSRHISNMGTARLPSVEW